MRALTTLLCIGLASCLIDLEETFPADGAPITGDTDNTSGDSPAGDPPAGDPGPPPPITNFVATASSERTVELSWTNPAGIDGVIVRAAGGGYPPSPNDGRAVFDGSAQNARDTDQPGNTEIFYAAWSWRGTQAERVFSATAATTAATPSDDTAPSAPTGLQLDPEPYAIAVSWTNPTDADFAYVEVYRDTVEPVDPASGIQPVYTGPNAATLDNVELVPDTKYYYAIWAYDDSGNQSATALTGSTTTPAVAAVGEFCDGGVACDPAVTNISCASRAVDTRDICVIDCSASGSNGACGLGNYCDSTSDWFGPGFSFCWPISANDTTCLNGAGSDACSADWECAPSASGGQSACRNTCTEVGTTCVGANDCLVAGTLELPSVTCTSPGGSAECTGGYQCRAIGPDDYQCARPNGRCGVEAAVLTDFSVSGILDHVADAANHCDAPGNNAFCPVPSTGTAWAECARVGGWITPIAPALPCTDDIECPGGSCDGGICNYWVHSCIFACEPELVGGQEFGCPAGLGCQIARTINDPAVDLLLPVLELDASGTQFKTCIDNTGCGTDYECVQFGVSKFCTRNRKVCQ